MDVYLGQQVSITMRNSIFKAVCKTMNPYQFKGNLTKEGTNIMMLSPGKTAVSLILLHVTGIYLVYYIYIGDFKMVKTEKKCQLCI